MLYLLRILLCTPYLLVSCYTDLKTRTVPNVVWTSLISFGVLIYLAELALAKQFISTTMPLLFSFSFVFILAYVLFQLGAFGGADAKALIAISVLIPSYPSYLSNAPFYPFAFSVFANAALVGILISIYPILKTRDIKYKIPFMIPITVGFFLSLLYYDWAWIIVNP